MSSDSSSEEGVEVEATFEEGMEGNGNAENLVDSLKIPVAESFSIKSHAKRVSAIAWDRSGARLATGSFDTHVHLWDFGGMTQSPKPFREIEVSEDQTVTALSYSPTGEYLLVASDGLQPRIMDREGVKTLTFIKGDTYLIDQRHTRGHTSRVTSLQWHPTAKDMVVTGSLDGTVRLWDLNGLRSFEELQCHSIVVVKNDSSRKATVHSVCFNRTGTRFAAGTNDGAVNLWPLSGNHHRPQIRIRKAHDCVVCCLQFTEDDTKIASRGLDGSIKIWDLRTTKSVFQAYQTLESDSEQAGMCFNQDCSVLVSTSSDSSLSFFDAVSYLPEPLHIVKDPEPSPYLSLCWHPTLNQIAVGRMNGCTKIFFDRRFSIKGATVAASREVKKKRSDNYAAIGDVSITPNSLPLFAEEAKPWSAKYRSEFFDNKSKILPQPDGNAPKVPAVTPQFTELYVQTHPEKRNIRMEDSREAILSVAKRAKDDPIYAQHAYKKTQPVTLFFDKTLEEETEDREKELLQHLKEK